MIKDKDIVQILLSSTKLTPNELVEYLSLIIKLKQYYGGILDDKEFYTILSNIDKQLTQIVMTLHTTKRNSIRKIKAILFLIKKMPNYQTQLKVAIKDKDFDELSEYLKEKLPKSKIVKQSGNDSEIRVSGNGWYYKKSFEKDVEKLLS